MADREDVLFQAKLSEQAERYDEMVETMKKVVKMGANLTIEERNLLSVSYKNAIGARRTAWRAIYTAVMQHKESMEGSSKGLNIAQAITMYQAQVEKELKEICQDILGIVDEYLLPSAGENQSKVFYYKMKGDYLRYLSEISTGDEHKQTAESSLVAYKSATDIAEQELPPTHPVRLGLALNLSVFYYEILQSPDKACQIAETAFSNAIKDLDTLNTSVYKDSSLILQLLQDNLTLWKSDCSDVNNAKK